jgi:hypothetical protein
VFGFVLPCPDCASARQHRALKPAVDSVASLPHDKTRRDVCANRGEGLSFMVFL